MIEITRGTLEEQVIKILQKTYPITIKKVSKQIHLSEKQVRWVLNQLQIKGIVKLDPLPDKTFIRLIRHDFRFVGKKRQRKFIKHHKGPKNQETEEYDGIMYS